MMTKAADIYAQLCAENERLPDVFRFLEERSELSKRDKLDVLLVDQFQRWKQQQAIPVDNYLERTPDLSDIDKIELLIEEFGYLEERGVAPAPVEFVKRYKSLDAEAFGELCDALEVETKDVGSSSSTGSTTARSDRTLPQSIGRYEVVRSIGKGSFGEVLLARDPELERSVAIKIPTRQRIEMGGGTSEFLNEARNVAKLDHPNIVPVYDCGQTEDGTCFVVSKYIKGKELRTEIRKGIEQYDAARITAQMARALHAAHRNGLVHRDVKPGNIILDSSRQPHLLDFGLALREQDDWNTESLVGTPAYMSPEQAAGGDHSVDGRSDIYSLGVVLYEMLTGRRPVTSSDPEEILKQVALGEVRPPRQLNDGIATELENICMKAVALKLSDRYSTAKDMADDLDEFLADNEQAVTAMDASGSSWNRRQPAPVKKVSSVWMPWVIGVLFLALATVGFVYLPELLNNSSGKNGDELASSDSASSDTASLDAETDSVETIIEHPRVAVIGFRNVSRQPESDWLGVAYSELLTSELQKSYELDVVPAESVSLLKSDLELFEVDDLGPATMEKVRLRSGSNLVLIGSYSPAGADLDQLRVEMKLLNAADRKTVSSLSESVALDEWEEFVHQAAAQVRQDLQLPPLDLMKTGQTSLGTPTDAEVARDYFTGLARMRQFDLKGAREHFFVANESDPSSAVIQDAIAQVLQRLGSENLAREHSRHAVKLTANLPDQIRRPISARNHLLEGRLIQAVAAYRELFEDHGGEHPAGVDLANAMIKAGQGRSALNLIKELRPEITHPSQLARLEITAADAAQSVSEFKEQAEFASRAVDLAAEISSPLLQAEALLRQGRALHRLGDREARKKLKQAFEFFDQQGDKHGAAAAIGATAKTYVDSGDLDTAEEKIEEAMELSSKIGNERLQNRFVGQLGELLIFRGNFDEAIKKLQESRDKFTRLGDDLNAAGVGLTLANVMARRGESDKARELILEARKAFQSSGNRQGEARSWGQQGAIHGRAGDPIKARTHFERALELFREVGDRRGEATCLGDLASTYSGVGDLEKAGQYMSESLELHRQIASRRGPSTVMFNLGLLYIRTGRPNDALPLLRESYDGFVQRGNQMNACFVGRKLGDLQMQFGDLQQAETTLNDALATAKQVGSKNVEAQALASLGDLAVFKGKFEQATEMNLRSREIRKELKQDGNMADNNLALARIAIREKRLDDAAEFLRMSKDALTMNRQGWDWIHRAANAQIHALKSETAESNSAAEARATLQEFEEFVRNRESQDVHIGLLLQLEHARLLAALEDQRALQEFDAVIKTARKQGWVAIELGAEVEQIEFRHAQSLEFDDSAAKKTVETASQKGFIEYADRLQVLLAHQND